MQAPIKKVMPLVFSTNRVKISATAATTQRMVLYSVLRKVVAPLRIMPAISAISSVPSFIRFTLRKLKRM